MIIKNRSSNIELLRIVAMVMIIGHHLTVHGVMHYPTNEQFLIWSTGSIVNKFMSAARFPGGEVGVGIFFIITGYFCVDKHKSSVMRIVLETMFYSVLMMLVLVIGSALRCPPIRYNFIEVTPSVVETVLLPVSGEGIGLLQFI